ncbi:hypothetical protein [Maricaulis maris]|uniref:Uncharacterized protein n=1 Tax=Maricaulis maris TaxID=74318 RepID=A0A495D1Q2_9PROT|nr:hypothetical protein [Maricaulis maris]RKQ95482.1 hypothetical protein C7435_2585 [Maricaulis maris]
MGIKRRTRIWTSVGTAALLGGLTGCSDPADAPPSPDTHTEAAAMPATAPGFSEGEGEGGEGGASGGEFGIDPVEAETNPVIYLTALEVMRAHYLAGIDAFQAGERTAGAEMFAHPISEIYIDFEPVLESRGAPLFGDTMTDASVAPYGGESDEAIAARVADVVAAIDAASTFAPRNQLSPAGVHARVLTDLIERAALQYEVLASQPDAHEPYLDGYGFARAAQRYAGNHLEQIAEGDPDLALQLGRAIAAITAAFPTATRPATLSGDSQSLLALAANARAGADALR